MSSEYDYIISCVIPKESGNCGCVVSVKMREEKEKKSFVQVEESYI